ncbi:hypothetical protein EH223_14735 [candidate division KSB1 bacterium]|nr:ribosomal L7Ae/L30e/S12e/Gadd45 family protein [candidate division KSB1 bacterium]RQW01572.1 MAG: hypothetical protein EH223_14735 [candidate division KSB1 bacterium]
MSEEKIKALFGFANKAGKLAPGRSAVTTAYFRKKLAAVVIATDASEKLKTLASDFGVQVLQYATKDELGQMLGRNETGIIGILDEGFAQSIQRAMTP